MGAFWTAESSAYRWLVMEGPLPPKEAVEEAAIVADGNLFVLRLLLGFVVVEFAYQLYLTNPLNL